MKVRIYRMVLALLALVVLATACAPVPQQPQQVAAQAVTAQIPEAMKTAYLGLAQMNKIQVGFETQLSLKEGQHQEGYSNFLVSAGESYRQVTKCYKDSEEVIKAGATGIFGENAGGNPVSAADENTAFIKALALGGNPLPGDIARCQTAAVEFMSWSREHRQTLYNVRVEIKAIMAAMVKWQKENLPQNIAIQFLNTWGATYADMIKNGQADLFDKLAFANGVQPLELDFIGFPTSALYVDIRSPKICAQNEAYYTGSALTPNGEPKGMFMIRWTDKSTGDCTLYRLGALNYIRRIFISEEAAARENCSTDAGFDQQVDPETCKVIEPTAEPTAQPKPAKLLPNPGVVNAVPIRKVAVDVLYVGRPR